jgi:hypothetical protein
MNKRYARTACWILLSGLLSFPGLLAADDKNINHPASKQPTPIPAADITGATGVPQQLSDSAASPHDAAVSNIMWYVLSSGGQAMTDGVNHHSGTVGQVAVGISVSGASAIHHGYWQNFGDGGEPCCGRYTGGETGNTDCDAEGKRTLSDVTTLIAHIYVTHVPLCCAANGNVDGDAESKLTLNDIMRLIDNIYISHDPCAPCP